MSTTPRPQSHFAPAERADPDDLRRVVQYFAENANKFELLDSVPDAIVILNRHRKVVYANKALVDAFSLSKRSDAHGLRPGDLFGCRHADEMPGGCGASKHCALCGAPQAILESLEGNACVRECRISLKEPGESLDLRVQASPLTVMGEPFSIFVVRDIADEKRRQVLERTFFHDILNTAGGLKAYADLMAESDNEELEAIGLREIMPRLAGQLMDEIVAQRILLHAENGQLEVRTTMIEPG